MQPMDTQGRHTLAMERIERLRQDAGQIGLAPGPVRVRLGSLLIAAGLRFAPDALPSRRPVSQAGAAPSSPGRARAARPG